MNRITLQLVQLRVQWRSAIGNPLARTQRVAGLDQVLDVEHVIDCRVTLGWCPSYPTVRSSISQGPAFQSTSSTAC